MANQIAGLRAQVSRLASQPAEPHPQLRAQVPIFEEYASRQSQAQPILSPKRFIIDLSATAGRQDPFRTEIGPSALPNYTDKYMIDTTPQDLFK